LKKRLGNPIRTLTAAFSLVLATAAIGIAQQNEEVNQQAMEWLQDIQANTVQIADRAAKLKKTITRHPATHERASHEAELLRVRNSINEIGDLVPKLQNRTDAPEWQKEIVDEVSSLLAAMGAQTEKALTFVREAPSDIQLYTNAYEARLAGIGRYCRPHQRAR